VHNLPPTSLGAVAEATRKGRKPWRERRATVTLRLDLAILPIVFLYRQYLELKLKELIDTSRL